MRLLKTDKNNIEAVTAMSVRAFETDIFVGGTPSDYPPYYDSIDWHRKMADEGHLYQAMIDDKTVGAAILFEDKDKRSLYIGRIFIDSFYHRKGYGIQLMSCIEHSFPAAQVIELDTPLWNVRTKSFYEKLGYIRIKEMDGLAFYQKKRENIL